MSAADVRDVPVLWSALRLGAIVASPGTPAQNAEFAQALVHDAFNRKSRA